MAEMLSWEEICRRYPHQWVGLRNETINKFGIPICGEVVFTDKTCEELKYEQFFNGTCHAYPTDMKLTQTYNGVYDENGHDIFGGGDLIE